MTPRASACSKWFTVNTLYFFALFAACDGITVRELVILAKWGERLGLDRELVDGLLAHLRQRIPLSPFRHLALREDPATVREGIRNLAAADCLSREKLELWQWIERLLADKSWMARPASTTPFPTQPLEYHCGGIPSPLRAACHAISKGELLLADGQAHHAHEELPSRTSHAFLAFMDALKREQLREWLLTRQWALVVAPQFVREVTQLTLPERVILNRLDTGSARMARYDWTEERMLPQLQRFVDTGLVIIEEQ